MAVQTVYFEDRGQEFLEFDVCDGHILASRPAKDGEWHHFKIVTPEHEIAPGSLIRVQNAKNKDAPVLTLRYPVLRIEPPQRKVPRQPARQRYLPARKCYVYGKSHPGVRLSELLHEQSMTHESLAAQLG